MHRSSGDEVSIAIEQAARNWAIELEAREAKRSGVSIRVARRIVARRMSIAPGTLENLKNRRLKGIRVWIVEKIRAAFMREIEQEIMRLTHELEVCRQMGLDAHEDQMGEIQAHLSALRELLR